MKTVEELARDIIAREGGYSDDPADPGGATNHGITAATLQRLGLDLTHDGKIDAEDVRAVTASDAETIFIDHYFRRPRLSALPEVLQPSVFDMYVNAGAVAVKILQRLLADLGEGVRDDGLVGAETVAAAGRAAQTDPQLLADAYGIARRNYYYRLGDLRPSLRKFARRRDGGKGGWILRAEEFISPRFHLTETQHRERTAKWA